MTTATTLGDPHATPPGTDPDDLGDRIHRLEGEVAELRHTLSELAEIVVGDIKERREAALAVSAPVGPEMAIPASLVPGGQAAVSAVSALRRPWLLVDLLREVGAAVKMYMDPRYRVRRSTQLMVPLLLGLVVANYFFFNLLLLHIPVVTEVVERLILAVLVVLLYKVIGREVARYRQTVAQLAVGRRAWNAVPASLLNNDPDTAAVAGQESP